MAASDQDRRECVLIPQEGSMGQFVKGLYFTESRDLLRIVNRRMAVSSFFQDVTAHLVEVDQKKGRNKGLE